MSDKILYIEDYQHLFSGRKNVSTVCPFCDDSRGTKGAKSFSINTETGAYHCFHCDAKGYLKSRFEEGQNTVGMNSGKPMYTIPKPIGQERVGVYGDGLLEYFKSRGISKTTLEIARVTQERMYSAKQKRDVACIGFNYYDKQELVNVKKRTRDKEFQLVAGAKNIPYNINSLSEEQYTSDEQRYGIITEGEMDTLTYIECGLRHVVSVPNGANSNLGWLDDYIDTHFDPLEVIYISSDSDKKGLELREELLRRFGKDRCKVVEYPSPCKDINEVLMKYGKEAVKECFDNAIEFKPDGINELIDVEQPLDYLFLNGFQKGCTIGIENIDNIISFKTGLLSIITGVPSHGKSLNINELLPSPNGWIKMGDVKVGDELYDKDGKICKVTYVTPIMYGHRCYKMTFSDGTEVVCDAEHLWVTRDYKARNSEMRYQKRIRENGTEEIQPRGNDQSWKRTFPKERTAQEIFDTLYVEHGKRCNHAVAVQGALEGREKELYIEPYVLGYWLGDGGQHDGVITTADQEVLDNIRSFGYVVKQQCYKYNYGVHGLKVKLRKYNLLYNKHIPSDYLRASVNDRIELLRGLMDSDGTCHKDGSCIYSSSDKNLADNVYELVVSLGLKATITNKIGKVDGVEKKMNYMVAFRPYFNCFTLERKSCRIKKYADDVNWRYIRKMEEVESVPVRCITVDSPSHTYLCSKSMIPTHNTFFLNFVLIRLNMIHNWKVAYFSPEFYPVHEHIAQVIETIGGRRFGNKNYDIDEYKKLKLYVEENFFWIDPDDTDINSVMQRAEYLIRKKGIKALVIDPFNALTDNERKNQKQDEYISEFLQKLRWFARKYDVEVFLVMHPTKLQRGENGLYPVCDLYNCKGASEIYDKADVGITVWRNEKNDYVEVHTTKVKFRHLGSKGKVSFKFNVKNGRYAPIPNQEELRLGDAMPTVMFDEASYLSNLESFGNIDGQQQPSTFFSGDQDGGGFTSGIQPNDGFYSQPQQQPEETYFTPEPNDDVPPF